MYFIQFVYRPIVTILVVKFCYNRSLFYESTYSYKLYCINVILTQTFIFTGIIYDYVLNLLQVHIVTKLRMSSHLPGKGTIKLQVVPFIQIQSSSLQIRIELHVRIQVFCASNIMDRRYPQKYIALSNAKKLIPILNQQSYIADNLNTQIQYNVPLFLVRMQKNH